MKVSKNLKYIILLLALIVIVGAIASGYVTAGLFLLLASYIANELFGSDHINYNVMDDYQYSFSNSRVENITLNHNAVRVPDDINKEQHTVLLEIEGTSTAIGCLLDPYVDIHCGSRVVRQYFERRFRGKRYLNVSDLSANSGEEITLKFKHCRLKCNDCRMIVMKNPDIKGKKVLVISPHPDDAEIAAFGLYSEQNSLVVTVTAGESEPGKHHQTMTNSADEAGLLKGQLRAWDSIAVPQWAGLSTDQAINLGYPDSGLEKLYKDPENVFPTQAKAAFRQFNRIRLTTDGEQSISWLSLVGDFSELLRNFKPDFIVTCHPTMDPHKDHQLSTLAIKQAVEETLDEPPVWLYYINHLSYTDRWPFGVHGSNVSLPPGTGDVQQVYSHTTNAAVRSKKACALEMMHDLRNPMKLKHTVRCWLQHKCLGRHSHPLGNDPYLRKGVRSNELFIVETQQKVL